MIEKENVGSKKRIKIRKNTVKFSSIKELLDEKKGNSMEVKNGEEIKFRKLQTEDRGRKLKTERKATYGRRQDDE